MLRHRRYARMELAMVAPAVTVALALLVLDVDALRHHRAALARVEPAAAPILLVLAAQLGLVVYVVAALTRELRRERRLVRGLATRPAHVAGTAVLLFAAERPSALCVGILRPRILVSDGLLALPPDQVRCVLAHERHHARRRDPLRRAVCQAVSFVPGMREAARARVIVDELAADAAAVAVAGVRPLAAALVAAGERPAPQRVDHLLGHLADIRAPRLSRAIMVVLAALAAWVASSASSGLCLPLAEGAAGLAAVIGLAAACVPAARGAAAAARALAGSE